MHFNVISYCLYADFPGMCFASTMCRVFEVGQTWELRPFCGLAECLRSPGGSLIEKVKDCGPTPDPNPDCQVSNPEVRNETYPACCPKYTCKEGVTLTYNRANSGNPQ